MQLCRFRESRLGLVEGSSVRDITAALDAIPNYRYPLPGYDPLIAGLAPVLERARTLRNAPALLLKDVTLLSPVANVSKIMGAPVNYQKHYEEARFDPVLHSGDPAKKQTIHQVGLFLKASSSLAGCGEGIVLRRLDRRNDHEVELAVVIGKRCDRVSRADALQYVAGYTIGLDISMRGSEERSMRKSPDTYTVLGPWLTTADEIPDPGSLDLSIAVNGEVRQSANTRDLIMDVPALIELASTFYTLHPGDVILTGTPEGVGPIVPGDVLTAIIDRIGTMEVHVRAA